MTDEELQKAIDGANKSVKKLCSSPTSGPFPQHEVRRREVILLRQLTLYEIEDAKECNRKDRERFYTEIYSLVTCFLESY